MVTVACMNDKHMWEITDRRLSNGWLDVEGARTLPPLWKCALCGASAEGDPAPDGVTADDAIERRYENLERHNRVACE